MEQMKEIFTDVLGPVPGGLFPPLSIVPDKKNYVLLAVDKSGSMTSIKKQAMEFYNSQVIEAQNASDMLNHICLLTFNENVKVNIWDVPAQDVKLLTEKNYNPDGYTAMLDAVGLGITKLLKQPDINDDNVSVLFIIVSDGYENASREHTYESIAKLINEVDKTDRWSFVYMGANQDLSIIQDKMAMPQYNTYAFSATPEGMTNATISNVKAAAVYYNDRKLGLKSTKCFYGPSTSDTDKSTNS